MAADKDLDDILASIRKIVVDEPTLEVDDAFFDPEPPVALPRAAAVAAETPAAPDAAVTPEPAVTLEATVRAMLTPLLKDWLDANLPRLVADAVDAATTAEIKRLTGHS